jgi:hypothetical protein
MCPAVQKSRSLCRFRERRRWSAGADFLRTRVTPTATLLAAGIAGGVTPGDSADFRTSDRHALWRPEERLEFRPHGPPHSAFRPRLLAALPRSGSSQRFLAEFPPPPFMLLLQTLGIDRILYSVDYPFSSNAPRAAPSWTPCPSPPPTRPRSATSTPSGSSASRLPRHAVRSHTVRVPPAGRPFPSGNHGTALPRSAYGQTWRVRGWVAGVVWARSPEHGAPRAS